MDGPWRLKDEDFQGFWTYPVSRGRFTKKMLRPGSFPTNGTYTIFRVVRRWYNTVTREFETTSEELRTFEEVLAEGRAIYDYRKGEYLMPPEEAVA